MIIAVLAVQGAFEAHQNILARLGVQSFPLQSAEDLNRPFDGLILPGGNIDEQSRMLRESKLMEPIRKLIHDGLPVLGT